MLLAVDAGLRTGLAAFDRHGRLVAVRSQHLANRTVLRRALAHLIPAATEVLAVEGGGPVADVWRREAERRSLTFVGVAAEAWRADLLLPRERRPGAALKDTSVRLARQVVDASALAVPRALTDDAAEAVLLGVWTAHRLGWTEGLPRFRR